MVQSCPLCTLKLITHTHVTHEPEPIYRCCFPFFFCFVLATAAHCPSTERSNTNARAVKMNTSKRKILRDGIPQQKACVGWKKKNLSMIFFSSLPSLDCKISFRLEQNSPWGRRWWRWQSYADWRLHKKQAHRLVCRDHVVRKSGFWESSSGWKPTHVNERMRRKLARVVSFRRCQGGFVTGGGGRT